MIRNIKIGILFGLVALFANTAEAASLSLIPSTGNYGVGDDISVDLKINSEGAGINAAQATLRYPKDTLTVKSISKDDSVLNFWLEEPNFSNDTGVISFIGGTPYGVSGASLQVLHIVFTSKGSGTAPITIADAAVTASDGSGTNVLSKTYDANFTISPTSSTPTAVSTTPITTAAAAVPAPVQIVREAVPAISGLPNTPSITVPLYPDPTLWYNISNIFSVSWTLPRDISGISTAINKQPNFTPAEVSEGLFDTKNFAALSDGVSYLHVRFENSAGWGPTVHYRLAIDTQPPLPLKITSNDGDSSDTPTPSFSFKSGDPTSGLSKYQIKIGNNDWIAIPVKGFKGTFKSPVTGPGKYHILVQAVDLAGNSIEDSIDHEILPLPAPIITFVTTSIFSDEPKGLNVKGTALPSTDLILSLKQGETPINSKIISVDAQGNWEYTFSDPLRNGNYVVNVQDRDARGALSLAISSSEIQVTGKYTNLIVVTFIILAGLIVAGTWYYRRRREQTTLRIDVAENDTSKVFSMIQSDIEKLKAARETPTLADDDFVIKKMEENVKKMSGYIKETIKKAKR